MTTAANPKQAAFLQAIEDRDDDDDGIFLDQPEDLSQVPDSQQDVDHPRALQESDTNVLKRKHISSGDEEESYEQGADDRSKKRRTGNVTRPTSLIDIRNTLSEIIGEDSINLDEEDDDRQSSYSSEEEEAGEFQRDSALAEAATAPVEHHKRTTADETRSKVIDRIALRRAERSASSRSSVGEGQGPMAFYSNSRAGSNSFKVPSLLRRATTNASVESDGKPAAANNTGGMGAKVIKMGGSKKSSINYHVRETERRQKIEKLAKERKDSQVRAGKLRRNRMGLGALAGGTFG